MRTPLGRMLSRVDYSGKSLARNTTGRPAWAFSSKNLRDARSFNYCTQPHELIYTLIWPHITPTFKTVHRRCADRARNYFALIEHCELNDGPIPLLRDVRSTGVRSL